MGVLRRLKQQASPFSLVDNSDVKEYMVVKREVVQFDDEVLAVLVGDGQTVRQCADCDYSCDSKKQRLCHSQRYHGHRHGLDRHTRAGILVHRIDRAPVCRLNMLQRREHGSEEAAEASAMEASAQRTSNCRGSRDMHFDECKCVRVYGPFLPVYDSDSEAVHARNGPPLGSGQKWSRPARLDAPLCNKFLFWDYGLFGYRCADGTAMAPRARACPASPCSVYSGMRTSTRHGIRFPDVGSSVSRI